jgi:hypothetical protein
MNSVKAAQFTHLAKYMERGCAWRGGVHGAGVYRTNYYEELL